MCGRYYIEIGDEEIEEITQKIKQKLEEESRQLTIKMDGEIFPTETVPVQTGYGEFTPMKWGFSGFSGNTLINARSETALEKKTFADSIKNRRCIIPASGYYEWSKQTAVPENTDEAAAPKKPAVIKTKHRIFIPGKTLHIAACWRLENGVPSFVILTREAQGSAAEIHDRMPVIIPQQSVFAWLHETHEAMYDAVTQLTVEAA